MVQTEDDKREALVSALQKFIRRGMEYEAVHVAFQLEENYPYNILWNRLKVIASEDVGYVNPIMSVVVETLYKQYFAEKTKLDKKAWDNSHRLFFVNAVICLCRSPKNRITDDLLNVVVLERENGIGGSIPAYCIDKHTAKGRAQGMGWKEFFEVGSHLENESGENPWKERHRQIRLNGK